VWLAVVVAALGYFVDIFDLLLFAIVRRSSLLDLGVPEHGLVEAGLWLDNILQMTGLVVGGVFWGMLGDRRGRLSVLFGSILCYSVANLLNAFIADVPAGSALSFLHAVGLGSAVDQYALLRFVAGFGLAGELGAGVTLVSELVSRERRGVATTIVATVGILGAVVAYFVAESMSWRVAYLVGGVLGLALLALRIGVVESGMFESVRSGGVAGRGAIWRLLWPPSRLGRYLAVILCGVPIWFCVGILVKYCDAIGVALGLDPAAAPSPGRAIMWAYVGLAAGDLASGLLSQWLRSRKRAIAVFQVLTAAACGLYFALGSRSADAMYAACAVVGFASGYWAVFVTTAAEQFGTDLRATVTTSAPNFVRWSAAGSALLWTTFQGWFPADPRAPWIGGALVALVVLPLAMLSLLGLRESFGRDLDFLEG
jgi:MFS transporter, putative metabolite:H+ symporter